MNILVIGNGFDRAHELPTGYDNFIDFLKVVKCDRYNKNSLIRVVGKSEICKRYSGFKEFFLQHRDRRKERIYNELLDLLDDNIWAKYFVELEISQRNWVGCEGDISDVIRAFDTLHVKSISNEAQAKRNNVRRYADQFFERLSEEDRLKYNKTEKMLEDLERLKRCLEIYLCLCMEFVSISKHIANIERFGKIDAILSFSYTDTFDRVYKPFLSSKAEYCYIHGKANIDNDLNSNNMVLGIDEYLEGDDRNKHVEYIGFKKYYQRIFKQTDYNYTSWLKDHGEKNIYIIGHSLDVTDRDVLRDIILQENYEKAISPRQISTTIFYHSKQSNASQITNLVKVLGSDNVNALARGTDTYRSIRFLPLEIADR